MDESFKRTLKWYSQFEIGTDDDSYEDLPLNNLNAFRKIPFDTIDRFEAQNDCVLPNSFREFLTHIGWGRLLKDINGNRSSCINIFLHPKEIEYTFRKDHVGWSIYEDEFIGENDIPFFQIEAAEFFVFDKCSGSDKVYDPGQYEVIAGSFHEFLEMLMSDSSFWAEKV